VASQAVRITTPTNDASAIHTIVLAFAADPIARWTWPQSLQYLATMPSLIKAFGGKAFIHGSAYCTEDLAGAALWLPPGVHPDQEMLSEIVRRSVSPSMFDNVSALFDRMATYHPSEPHWYLPLIGVDPAHQGKGIGNALMKFALERCDQDGAPAYLESTSPRNVSLYRSHGFEALGTILVGSSPPMTPMLRPVARRS
jgi:ribosomal protein S18 acetylase RimI-like enzyme